MITHIINAPQQTTFFLKKELPIARRNANEVPKVINFYGVDLCNSSCALKVKNSHL